MWKKERERERDWSHSLYPSWKAVIAVPAVDGCCLLLRRWGRKTLPSTHDQVFLVTFFHPIVRYEFTEQLLSFSLSFPVLFLMVYFLALWFSITQRFQQVVYTTHLCYRSGIKNTPNAALQLHLCLDLLPDLNIMVSNSAGLRHLSYPNYPLCLERSMKRG